MSALNEQKNKPLPTDYYGENVFNDKAMRQHLPKAVYKSLKKTIEKGEKLDPAIADVVASAIKDWAVSKGATHYTHVFYPLTDNSAEKHDGFLTPDENGGAIAEFSGSNLVKGEADGSSLPSGGLRSTFEARGYTAWDVTSPAYVMENAGGIVLCIPTFFLSWTGLALDKKTPLLRSNQAINKQAQRILKLFGVETNLPIAANGGLEQEYFLVDRDYVMKRPDLLIAGRTLFGAKPPKGQEFEDQYYGVIPERVFAYMIEVEQELYKLGVPVKTRHNEVAPSQYEIAPLFEAANLATDHNQLIMTVLRRVARKHNLVCLLHEKPFQGLNGSGKHVNYSIGNREVGNLFDPGETPHENAQFLVFLCAVIRAVHKYGAFLRATVASASNDFRLGAHEAPPAIMSLFIGDQLQDVLEQFRIGEVKGSRKKRMMNVGVDTLPPIPADPGDRNRTSPFAFVGNRFEFRAVGSSQNPAGSIVALNTMVAESLDFCATFIERELQKGNAAGESALGEAVQKLIAYVVEEHSAVLFNGDGYSQVWHKEAERRKLPIHPHTPDALPVFTHPEIIDLCTRYNVLCREELRSRQEVYFEQYIKTTHTEGKLALSMARTNIFPAVMRYQTELAKNHKVLAGLGIDNSDKLLKEVSELIIKLDEAIRELQAQISHDPVDAKDRENAGKNPGLAANIQITEAEHCRSKILPAMKELRQIVDTLESMVAEDLWPFPSYQNMLFVK